MEIIFVVNAKSFASSDLRGRQIAEQIGGRIYTSPLTEPFPSDAVAIFVKNAIADEVQFAHSTGCKIVYDPVDTFAYPERHIRHDWHTLVDTVIAYNETQTHWFRENFFPQAASIIIPHQWDSRMDKMICPQDRFRAAYIGQDFNAPLPVDGVARITDSNCMLAWAGHFNCHVDSLRDPGSLEAMHKPATKIATAAAVGAVIITTPTGNAMALLGHDYPFYVSNATELPEMIAHIRTTFGNKEWIDARKIMHSVRDALAPEIIAKIYHQI